MKTLLTSLTILCFFCVFALNSKAQLTPQLTKGSLLIGTTTSVGGDFYDFEHLGGGNTAGLSFGSTWSSNGSTSDKNKYTSYNLTPRAGYFFMDGLAAGLNINIRGQSNKDGDDKDKISTTTLGPWVRYYAMQWALLGGKIVPFAEGKAAWGSSKETYTSGSSSNTYKWGVSEYGIGPGLALFIVDYISLDMMIAYRKATWKDKDASETTKYHDSTFGFTFGLTVLIPPCW
jgi:hypothetical protein